MELTGYEARQTANKDAKIYVAGKVRDRAQSVFALVHYALIT